MVICEASFLIALEKALQQKFKRPRAHYRVVVFGAIELDGVNIEFQLANPSKVRTKFECRTTSCMEVEVMYWTSN